MANDSQAHQQPPQPSPDLRNLGTLVGTWKVSGGPQGRVTFEWMEGGFFLIQHVDLEQYGQKIKGLEIIGHERLFGAERHLGNMALMSNTNVLSSLCSVGDLM